MLYELVLTPDDNGTLLVTAPAFPEVTSFGADKADAILNGRSAVEEAIAARIEGGSDIPPPLATVADAVVTVELPAIVLLKAGLYMHLRAKGWTRADLMRALGVQREHVDRLFRLDHNSRLDSLEAAFKALDQPLRFNMVFPQAA